MNREQQVCLERVTSSDLGLSGTIQVRNVAFEKQVSVRYTFNQWESIHELSTLLQFAARYQVNGQEYWDNNRGKNYTLRCRTHPLKLPRESGVIVTELSLLQPFLSNQQSVLSSGSSLRQLAVPKQQPPL
ncbi:hypothetical protein IHE44_0004680 [Lamprotornis superbus]|uniref:CBM21 domain-containing protein n=1 Tax=Lamprotornis superbus TaxID=245042 RepID=A0A835TYL1_9PASS|nr:hypothetical protein IHE44_0004680 [Lamprotornis superbus]